MRKCFLILVAALFVFAFITPGFAQVAQKSGSIFGKVVDDKGAPLPGVNINMESNVGRGQTAVSGPTCLPETIPARSRLKDLPKSVRKTSGLV
jgi:hypothetical protein